MTSKCSRCARDVAARLVVDEADARIAIEVAGEVAEAAVQRLEDVGVDLDADDRLRAEAQRRQDVAAAADADDQRAPVRPQVVADVGDVVFEVLELLGRRRRLRQHGAGGDVDVEVQLLDPAIGRDRRGSGPRRTASRARSGLPFTRMREYEFQRS